VNHLPLPPGATSTTDDAELRALQATLAEAGRNPWLASIFMRRLDTLRRRFAELCDWLRALPRRLRRGLARRWALALPAAALMMALASWAAMAKMDATITVGVGGCTLADAITAANTDTATGGCGAGSGADTISFNAANGTYSYTSALPDITTDITIQGNGNTTIQRTGGGGFRILTVAAPSGNLTLDNSTISGGSVSGGSGGGIHVASGRTANITDSMISGNSTSEGYLGGGRGGGIFVASYATVSLTDSTVSGNWAGPAGGGIYAGGASTVVVTDSTIAGNTATSTGGGTHHTGGTGTMHVIKESTVSGNTARDGGGIYIGGRNSSVTLTNSTISGNTATSSGGGIFLSYRGIVTLRNCTVTGNLLDGIREFAAGPVRPIVYIANSIVAHQATGADCSGIFTLADYGYNLESATSCGFTLASDQQSVTSAQLNLGALLLNPPGTTRTHALGTGSFALDKIPSGTNGCGTTITTDQRGVSRPQSVLCDVGTFEAPIPGDCNADSNLDAADFPAIVLRIFSNQFAANPLCDANLDSKVDAGDLACAVRQVFFGRGSCNSP